ncbi:MAG: hypothetical protein HDR72_03590 [Ruminococcaceae bacterium]|nr:hypothetical protein [Oscillospiraceae bacterium]
MELYDIGGMLLLIVVFFIRQTVLLSYGAFIALLIGKKTIDAAADIMGALFILLLVIADPFMPCALALADISADNRIIIAIEVCVIAALFVVYFCCFGKSRDKLDERS